jgi:hypothetical protein
MRRVPAALVVAVVGLVAAVPAESAVDVSATVDDVAGVNDTTSPRRNQPEPSLAINPRNTDVIAAGAQDFRRARELRAACGGDRWNGFYLSADGGQTWSNELVPGYCTDPTGGAGSEQAVSDMFGFSTNTDPVLVFDPFGNLFYSHIAFNANMQATTPPSTSGLLLVSTYRVSDAGAARYAKTESVLSGSGLSPDRFDPGPGQSNFDDKQWMTVDTTPGSPFYGRVYVTWTKFGAEGGDSSIYVSHCGGDGPGAEECDGSDWSRGHVLNTPVAGGLVQESWPAAAPDGTLYVAFLQFQGGFGSTLPHAGVWVAKSSDGGSTFSQRKVADISQIPSPIPPRGTAANDGLNSFRTGTIPTIGVTSDGTVHLAWGQWNGTDADVVYVRSTNGGTTWSAPIRMGDVAAGHQFFPSLDTDGTAVHVAWNDSRLDPTGTISALDVFYNRSANAGRKFAADERVTDVSFDPNAVSRFPVFCQAFIGDYLDIDAVDGTVAAIWTDNRNVTGPLSPTECRDFIGRSTEALLQPRLDSGALDQEAFTDVIAQP